LIARICGHADRSDVPELEARVRKALAGFSLAYELTWKH
jgi:hypothetical protein